MSDIETEDPTNLSKKFDPSNKKLVRVSRGSDRNFSTVCRLFCDNKVRHEGGIVYEYELFAGKPNSSIRFTKRLVSIA